jgi:hypothetical protein
MILAADVFRTEAREPDGNIPGSEDHHSTYPRCRPSGRTESPVLKETSASEGERAMPASLPCRNVAFCTSPRHLDRSGDAIL